MKKTDRHGNRGTTTLEIVVSMGVVVLFLSGVFLMNTQVLSLLRGSLESTASLRVLNDRAEHLRASTWSQITTASYHSGSVLFLPPDSAEGLAGLTETIQVTAHLAPPSSIAPITVQRDRAGTVTTTSAGSTQLAAEPSVRVDLTASWIAKGGRQKMRQLSLFFGEGGISGKR